MGVARANTAVGVSPKIFLLLLLLLLLLLTAKSARAWNQLFHPGNARLSIGMGKHRLFTSAKHMCTSAETDTRFQLACIWTCSNLCAGSEVPLDHYLSCDQPRKRALPIFMQH
jgi:hypothetical protein